MKLVVTGIIYYSAQKHWSNLHSNKAYFDIVTMTNVSLALLNLVSHNELPFQLLMWIIDTLGY